MENSEGSLYAAFKRVNDVDIVEYLASQGYIPETDRNGKARYCSPIREGDSDPSFIVFRRNNTWHDFGTGQGKSLVDLGMILHRCSAVDFVLKFDALVRNPLPKAKPPKGIVENKVKILDTGPLTDYELTRYVRSTRKIPLDIARRFCGQAHFEINKQHLGVAFRNDQGGYELRNGYMKVSSLPKDSTFIDNGSNVLDVLEGCFDFLTDVTMHIWQNLPLPNFLVLNGTGFFNQKIPLMLEHDRVNLLLDHGKGARKFTKIGLSLDKKKFFDESWFFSSNDDLNEWWQLSGYNVYLAQYLGPRQDALPKRGLRL